MTDDLSSRQIPPVGPADHLRGDGDAVTILYADFTCPHCAVTHLRLRDEGARVAFRHFALRAKQPRAVALACAAEAVALQGAFWPFADALFADRGRQDDPHLWARCEALGLDLGRFEEDRRSPEVAERVRRSTREAMRAGVMGTPAVFSGTGPDAVKG